MLTRRDPQQGSLFFSMETITPAMDFLHFKNKIDPTQAPFSDLGSPLLVYKKGEQNCFHLRIAHRFSSSHSTPGSFQERPPCLDYLSFTDQHGAPLDFELTSYPHTLHCKTKLGTFQLAIHEKQTLAIGLPQGVRCGIQFQVNPPLKGHNTQKDPSFQVHTTATGLAKEIPDTPQSKIIQRFFHSGGDDALYLIFGDQDPGHAKPPPFSQTLADALARWQRWFSQIPIPDTPGQDSYMYAWWVLGNNLIDPQGYISHRGVMPSKAKYIGIWNWDACFHALALRHVDPGLARDQLRIFLQHQGKDGMLPDAVHQESVTRWIDHPFPNQVTKPPLIAWTALKIHDKDPDPSFLREIYPGLVAWHDWWMSKTDEHGLAQYHHPYSSGLDDSPLWDYDFPVTSPDLNTYLVLQCESLGEMCSILGRPEKAEAWFKVADELTERMLDVLFCPQKGYFLARGAGKSIPEFTPFNLYPLWTGRLPAPIQNRLLDHLQDPTRFGSSHALATVDMQSPSYDPEMMWRGPVWININYLFIEALSRIGEASLANRLRDKTLDLVNSHQDMHEYYNSQTGLPSGEAAPMFSWTAAAYIDLLLSTVPSSSDRSGEERR